MNRPESSETPTPAKRKRAKRRFEIKIVRPDGFSMRLHGTDLEMTGEALDRMAPLCDAVLDVVTKFYEEKRHAYRPHDRAARDNGNGFGGEDREVARFTR